MRGDRAEVAEAVEERDAERGRVRGERAIGRVREVERRLRPVRRGDPLQHRAVLVAELRLQDRGQLLDRDAGVGEQLRMARGDPGAGQDRVLEAVGEREPGRVQQIRRAPDRRPRLDPRRDAGEADADLAARPLAVARDRARGSRSA